MAQLLALPLSQSGINDIAANYTTTALLFYSPVYSAKQSVLLRGFYNTTYPEYNSSVANATALLSRLSNATLNASLSNIVSIYSTIEKNGINQNITQANATFQSAFRNFTNTYKNASSQFLPVYHNAQNSTALIIIDQLDYQGPPPPNVGALASEQAYINTKLNAKLNMSEVSMFSSQIRALASQARSLSAPVTTPSVLKSIDGGAVTAILAGQSGTIAQKTASAPLWAAIISMILGIIIVLVIIEFTYVRLSRNRRIIVNSRVKRAWTVVFLILFLLVVIYALGTYAIAQSANAFLPASGFISAVSGSNTVVIVQNQTTEPITQCMASLKATLNKRGFTVETFNLTGSCIGSSGAVIPASECYDSLIASGSPIINVSSSSNSSIVYRGLYGNILYVSGQPIQGPACLINTMAKVV